MCKPICLWFVLCRDIWGGSNSTPMPNEPQACFFLVTAVIRTQFYGGPQKRELLDNVSRVAVVSPRDHSKPDNGIDHPNAEGTRTMPGAQRTEMPVRGRIRKADADV